MIQIFIKRLSQIKPELPLPFYQTSGSAGMDLMADIKDTVILEPGQRKLVPTGLAFSIPVGFEVQIRPRSGLAIKKGITLLNTPGTIDSDYRGEVQIILVNLGQDTVRIERGERIAQMIVAPIVQANLKEVDDLDSTTRGAGGFGSTGG
ncbi:MAG TPA: dUTP diphosphatase [Deltaproteobacteria bacterium]|nr:MAG: deoxyuridine 5'-triphosphate nucleotidohydrolase [Deltaproteobacteria bacterium GWA2_45_12]HBF13873.1 dUTP diphosphatase [Deltaproteobacteria bacterium]